MTAIANLFMDDNVVYKSGQQVNLASHCEGKTVGIYFSAHWCPPCRGFTPILVEFYNKYKDSKNFEIIFVSSDSDEASFKEYYNEMPWLALEFKNRNKKAALSDQFRVEGIPTLVLLNADTGVVYTNDARSFIQYKDTKGNNFPWDKVSADDETQTIERPKRIKCTLL